LATVCSRSRSAAAVRSRLICSRSALETFIAASSSSALWRAARSTSLTLRTLSPPFLGDAASAEAVSSSSTRSAAAAMSLPRASRVWPG